MQDFHRISLILLQDFFLCVNNNSFEVAIKRVSWCIFLLLKEKRAFFFLVNSLQQYSWYSNSFCYKINILNFVIQALILLCLLQCLGYILSCNFCGKIVLLHTILLAKITFLGVNVVASPLTISLFLDGIHMLKSMGITPFYDSIELE